VGNRLKLARPAILSGGGGGGGGEVMIAPIKEPAPQVNDCCPRNYV